MPPVSAGLLLYRLSDDGGIEVLLAHPGGPFWRSRDAGAWQIPKGVIEPGEDAQAAARREFAEEVGGSPEGALIPLGEVRQAGGKRVIAFACHGDFDPAALVSQPVTMAWPRGSDRIIIFPEVDRVLWCGLPEAEAKMLPSQQPLLDRLVELVASPVSGHRT